MNDEKYLKVHIKSTSVIINKATQTPHHHHHHHQSNHKNILFSILDALEFFFRNKLIIMLIRL